MTKIDPTTFKPGDIVHVRGRVYSFGSGVTDVEFANDEVLPFSDIEIVAHFPAIRSWSEIEGRLSDVHHQWQIAVGDGPTLPERIIALLNEIDPKGDV
jgi:hypothetical protein